MNKLDVALNLYTQVFNHLEQNFNEHNQLAGDVSVKISNIFLGKGEKLGGKNFLSKALIHLFKARDAYKECLEVNESEDSDGEKSHEVLSLKLLETTFAIANVHMELDEIHKASDTYQVRENYSYFILVCPNLLFTKLTSLSHEINICILNFNLRMQLNYVVIYLSQMKNFQPPS